MQSKPRLLFVDDNLEALYRMRQMLADKAGEWELLFAESGQAALDLMIGQSVEIIVAEMHMKAMTGVELLKQVALCFPKTVRFLVCAPEDKDLATQGSGDLHQLITRPLEAAALRQRFESALALNRWLQNDSIREMVSKMRAFRSLPSIYQEVMRELQSPSASAATIGDIIGRDLAITAKLLQVVNSVFFGLQQRISTPTEAVFILGLDTVRSLVLSVHAYAELDKVKPLYFSMDKLWRHSMGVAHRARRIAQAVSRNEEIAEEAFTAGLFHDIGKLVLASHLAETYSGGLALARKRQIPVWEVETELFGASHAETGAYLVGLWGLDVPVLEAIALHHTPLRSGGTEFSALTAVHVADVLEHEAQADGEGFSHPVLDGAYLRRLGLEDHVDAWRAVEQAAARSSPQTPTGVQPMGTGLSDGQNSSSSVACEPEERRALSWMIWAAAGAVTIGATCWWTAAVIRHQTTPVAAKAVPRSPAPDLLVRPPPVPKAIEANPPRPPGPPALVAQDVETSPSPAAPVPPAPGAAAELKLQGIFYRKSNPTAMINGQTVQRGGEIEGARVIAIDRQSVTLQRGGQVLVLHLK
ncbi:MAG TPA: response regulator [Methylomirabilota bacterium]|nr:response regulator [Methylomirabilota bacterium]